VRRLLCLLGLTFFGLTPNSAPEFRKSLFQQIHSIVFHGKGGYDFGTIYNMPIWLRKFTLFELNNFYTEQNEQRENAKKGNKNATNMVNPDGTVNTPAFLAASKPYKGKTDYK